MYRSPLLDLLPSTDPLPLPELNLRTRMPPESLLEQLKSLVEQGLIDIEGDHLPDTPDQLGMAKYMVRLSTKGTRRSIA